MVNLASNPNVWATLVGILALALAPLAFLLWFFYTRDKLNPEPRGLILRVFGLGLLAFMPIFVIRQFLPLPYGLMGLVVVPILSELAKFGVVKGGVYNHAEFDEPVDGMIFAAVAGLGFASLGVIGSMLYAYLHVLRLGPTEVSGSAWGAVMNMFALQGLLMAPGHALWSSLWGYGLGLAKFSRAAQANGLVAKGLLAAILAHAAFNGLAMELGWWVNRLGLVVLIILLWLVVMRCIRYALALSPYQKA
ncbi:MAG TPA: PrsW family intramembrane metalloprotease [Leptolyngbyaceae cyanobacterium M65_K2018_010]|nr:PrsW family intramembrane metalloprotease [Leptolyngbyaceae cyanobacterium M65_K2018_010]